MTDNTRMLLTVTVGDQHFGLDVRDVQEILPREVGTPVPQSGKRISGLINIRGHIVTLVDVRTCLGMKESDAAKMNVTVEHDGEIYGLLFDSVGDIIEIGADDMETIPTVLNERWHGMADGIFIRPKNLLIKLNKEQLVTAAWPEGARA